MRFPTFALLALSLAFATPALAEVSPGVQKAQALLEAGKTREAVAALEAALAHNQSDIDALIRLSLLYGRSELPDEALAQAQAAVRVDPRHQEALLIRGMAWEGKGDTVKALADYEAALAVGPYGPAFHNRALLRSTAGDHERALADFRAAQQASPDNPESAYGAALELESLDRYPEALVAYDQALAIDPIHYSVLHDKLQLLEHLQRWDAAEAALGVLIKAYPKDAATRVAQGSHWLARGERDKALAAFTLATRLDPDMADAWWNRGVTLRGDGKFKQALEALDRAVLLTPANAELLADRGLARWFDGDKGAMVDFDAALKVDPKSVYALYSRARYHNDREDWAKAMVDLDAVLAADPKYAPAYSTRALTHLGQNRHDRALADIKQALALSPTAYAYSIRAQIYSEMGDHLQAVEAYDEAIRIDGAEAYYWLGRSLSKKELGDAAGAEADHRQARKLDPSVPS